MVGELTGRLTAMSLRNGIPPDTDHPAAVNRVNGNYLAGGTRCRGALFPGALSRCRRVEIWRKTFPDQEMPARNVTNTVR